MKTTPTAVCLGVAAFVALVLPLAAQAANTPILTAPTGTPLAAGSLIQATSTGNSLLLTTAGSTELTCTSVKMTGKLTSNVTGNVQGNITSASFTGTGFESSCTGIFNAFVVPESLPWCLKSNETNGEDEFTVSGAECTKTPTKIKFSLLAGSGARCTYESTSTTAVRGTFRTDTEAEDAILSTPRSGHTPTEDSGFTKITDDILFNPCPSSSALKMMLTLETDSGTVQPIYITK